MYEISNDFCEIVHLGQTLQIYILPINLLDYTLRYSCAIFYIIHPV